MSRASPSLPRSPDRPSLPPKPLLAAGKLFADTQVRNGLAFEAPTRALDAPAIHAYPRNAYRFGP